VAARFPVLFFFQINCGTPFRFFPLSYPRLLLPSSPCCCGPKKRGESSPFCQQMGLCILLCSVVTLFGCVLLFPVPSNPLSLLRGLGYAGLLSPHWTAIIGIYLEEAWCSFFSLFFRVDNLRTRNCCCPLRGRSERPFLRYADPPVPSVVCLFFTPRNRPYVNRPVRLLLCFPFILPRCLSLAPHSRPPCVGDVPCCA